MHSYLQNQKENKIGLFYSLPKDLLLILLNIYLYDLQLIFHLFPADTYFFKCSYKKNRGETFL